MSFDFPFVRLFGVRKFCYYPYILIAIGDVLVLSCTIIWCTIDIEVADVVFGI